jgi:hypothetical protein
MFITRPDSFIAFMLNTMVGNCLGHKLQAENLLRNSGLDYTIVRPGGLKGGKDDTLGNEENLPVESPEIHQGDTGTGYIHRHSVGKLIANQLISNSEIPTKCTFELIATKDPKPDQLIEPIP